MSGEQEAKSSHKHRYRVTAAESFVVRWCETCGATWMMSQFHELIHDVYFYRWTQIQEPDEAPASSPNARPE